MMSPVGDEKVETERGEALTAHDVGLLILEAVGVLHARGHQHLRVFSGMSGSGLYWRIAITHSANVSGRGATTHPRKFGSSFSYTTAAGLEVSGESVDRATTASDLADRILAVLPDPGLGRDWEYAGWYVELLGLVRRYRALPIAYADYFDPEAGWEIGWGSGLRIPHPPSAAEEGTLTQPEMLTGATFTGTIAQFNRFLGPHWRVLVQQTSKKHKATIGACQFDPAHEGPFDAAHIHGRERTTLLRGLLGDPKKGDVFTVDMVELEAKFKAEHHPIEKSILVLCKSCHTAYDSPANVEPSPVTISGAATGEPSSGGEVPSGSLVLPITLTPRGVGNFKAAVLANRLAWIDVTYRDGHIERLAWSASKLTEASDVIGNLRTRPDFRQGKWQAKGIVAVHVTARAPEPGSASPSSTPQ